MKVEVSEKTGEMKFIFHLDGDDGGSSTNVRMVNDSATFQVPSDLSGMIHPDLIALTAILCCHPFVGKELHLPYPVSKEFLSEARRVITRYSLIGKTSEKIAKREPPENSRPGLAFSGGVDSTAALSVMPPVTVPVFLKRPKKKSTRKRPKE